MAEIIRRLIDALFEIKKPETDTIRFRYTRDICRAVVASGGDWGRALCLCPQEHFDWRQILQFDIQKTPNVQASMPAAAAATGDLGLFRSLVRTVDDVFCFDRSLIPDAFSAAVANGQLTVVRWILESTMLSNIKDLTRSQHLERALGLAAHRFQNGVAITLVDAICSATGDAWADYWILGGVVETIRNRNNWLLVELLRRRQAADPQRSSTETTSDRIYLTTSEQECLFSEGSCGTLEYLIRTGVVHPDNIDHRNTECPSALLIDLAMKFKRRDLVDFMLSKGANINARAGGADWNNKSSLQHAVDRATKPDLVLDVQFLIEAGADPATIRRGYGHQLAVEVCRGAALHIKNMNTRLDSELWRKFWASERSGRLKALWEKIEHPQAYAIADLDNFRGCNTNSPPNSGDSVGDDLFSLDDFEELEAFPDDGGIEPHTSL